MKIIHVTGGRVAFVDGPFFDHIAEFKWQLNAAGYAVTQIPDPARPGKRKTVKMHRFLGGMLFADKSDRRLVDHWDGDRLNNQRWNLRVATNVQNARNQRKSVRSTSGYKGATWHKPSGKWQASIRTDGARRHLGYFATPKLAHEAYCAAAARHHGIFANAGVSRMSIRLSQPIHDLFERAQRVAAAWTNEANATFLQGA